MKKANLYLSSIERQYVQLYKELPETTMRKFREQGVESGLIHDIIQKRMDAIWKGMREKAKTDKDGFTTAVSADCPFLT